MVRHALAGFLAAVLLLSFGAEARGGGCGHGGGHGGGHGAAPGARGSGARSFRAFQPPVMPQVRRTVQAHPCPAGPDRMSTQTCMGPPIVRR